MKFELPQLKRCCCCLPLRYGLIALGCIKMVLLLLATAFAITSLVYLIQYSMKWNMPGDVYNGIIISIVIMTLLMDSCLTIVLLIGGYRKSPKMLHVYYINEIVFLCLYTLFFTWTVSTDVYYAIKYDHFTSQYYFSFFLFSMKMQTAFWTIIIGIHVYIILLIRSEVKKLRNWSTFRFENHSAELERALENGTNVHGTTYSKEEVNVNEPDSQFEAIINHKKAESENFTGIKI